MSESSLTFDPTPAGVLQHGRTTYTVHAITNFGALTTLRDRAVAVLCGKRGAQYLLMDNGEKYTMTVYNMGNTKGWGGRAAFGNPWTRDGGFRDRAAVIAMLGRKSDRTASLDDRPDDLCQSIGNGLDEITY